VRNDWCCETQSSVVSAVGTDLQQVWVGDVDGPSWLLVISASRLFIHVLRRGRSTVHWPGQYSLVNQLTERLADLLIYWFISVTSLNSTLTTDLYTLCSKKSDAKIQITIITAHLIRIKYPLSSFIYHFSDVNYANFNKIHHTVSEQQLF